MLLAGVRSSMTEESGFAAGRESSREAAPVDRPSAGGRAVQAGGGRASTEDHALAAAAIGSRVRRLRKGMGLTLDQLAARSGVSRAMLSNVERDEKNPTLPVVVRIALGLDVSVSKLMGAEDDQGAVSVLRRADRLTYTDPETGFERHILSPQHRGDGVELLLHRIPPGQSSGPLSAYSRPTHKYLVVQEGELTVVLESGTHVLQAGDSLSFEVTAPYRFDNGGSAACAYLMVIVHRG